MKKSKDRIIIIILAFLLIAAIIYILLNLKDCNGGIPSANHVSTIATDDEAVDFDGNHQTAQKPKGQSGIAVPGFRSLAFKSNETKQSVNFFNPKQNSCLFKMRLVVDGKTYWQSGNVEPGKGFYEITLTEPIPKGKYDNAFLMIECKKYDSTPLNSANLQFELEVF